MKKSLFTIFLCLLLVFSMSTSAFAELDLSKTDFYISTQDGECTLHAELILPEEPEKTIKAIVGAACTGGLGATCLNRPTLAIEYLKGDFTQVEGYKYEADPDWAKKAWDAKQAGYAATGVEYRYDNGNLVPFNDELHVWGEPSFELVLIPDDAESPLDSYKGQYMAKASAKCTNPAHPETTLGPEYRPIKSQPEAFCKDRMVAVELETNFYSSVFSRVWNTYTPREFKIAASLEHDYTISKTDNEDGSITVSKVCNRCGETTELFKIPAMKLNMSDAHGSKSAEKALTAADIAKIEALTSPESGYDYKLSIPVSKESISSAFDAQNMIYSGENQTVELYYKSADSSFGVGAQGGITSVADSQIPLAVTLEEGSRYTLSYDLSSVIPKNKPDDITITVYFDDGSTFSHKFTVGDKTSDSFSKLFPSSIDLNNGKISDIKFDNMFPDDLSKVDPKKHLNFGSQIYSNDGSYKINYYITSLAQGTAGATVYKNADTPWPEFSIRYTSNDFVYSGVKENQRCSLGFYPRKGSDGIIFSYNSIAYNEKFERDLQIDLTAEDAPFVIIKPESGDIYNQSSAYYKIKDFNKDYDFVISESIKIPLELKVKSNVNGLGEDENYFVGILDQNNTIVDNIVLSKVTPVTRILTSDTVYKGSSKALPLFDVNGNPMTYKAKLLNTVSNNNKLSQSGDFDNNMVLEDFVSPVGDIVTSLVYDDGGNAMSARPEKVKLKLTRTYPGGSPETVEEIEVKTDKTSYTFKNKPLFTEEQKPYTYKLEILDDFQRYEESAEVLTQPALNTTGVANGTAQVKLTADDWYELNINKVWADDSTVPGNAAQHPRTVSVDVFDGNTKINSAAIEFESTGAINLWAKRLDGTVITYKVAEKPVDKYAVTYSAISDAGENEKSITITNTLIPTIDLHVEKLWKNTVEPLKSIKVQLMAKAGEGEWTQYGDKVKISREKNDQDKYEWKHVFEDLPTTDFYGNKMQYKVVEDQIKNYDVQYSEAQKLSKDSDDLKITITNTRISTAVPTGDESNLGLWLGIGGAALVAVAVVAVVVIKKSKKDDSEE